MCQRQRGAGLHLAQAEAGVQVLHVRQLEQHVHGQPREGVEVGGHHLQLEGAGAADVVAGHHLGAGADGVFQRARAFAVVALGVQAHEGQHAQADLAAVDLGPVAGDVALLFQPLHAPPGGRGRQADARGELGVGQARVGAAARAGWRCRSGRARCRASGARSAASGAARTSGFSPIWLLERHFFLMPACWRKILAQACLSGHQKKRLARPHFLHCRVASPMSRLHARRYAPPCCPGARRMNAPLPEHVRKALETVTLDDKYSLGSRPCLHERRAGPRAAADAAAPARRARRPEHRRLHQRLPRQPAGRLRPGAVGGQEAPGRATTSSSSPA